MIDRRKTDNPERDFAELRERMQASGKRYCVAWGNFYNADFEHFDDIRDAMARFAVIARDPRQDTCGIYEVHAPPITTVYSETEIPF